MHKWVLAGIISLLLSSHAYSQSKHTEFPVGWKPASVADYDADSLAYRNICVPNHVEGDFDGDGISDDAWLLVNDASKEFGVFVFLRQKNGSQRIVQLSKHKKELDQLDYGISLAKPGAYETVCGKDFPGCQPDDLKVLKLQQPGIRFFVFEGAEAVYFWDHNTKAFLLIWLSD